jgi:hypothetical protein
VNEQTLNPNDIINNLARQDLTAEEEHVLRFRLKHGLATRQNEPNTIASAESIWEQIHLKNLLPDSFIKQKKLRIPLKLSLVISLILTAHTLKCLKISVKVLFF